MGPIDWYSGCNVSKPGVNWRASHTNTLYFCVIFLGCFSDVMSEIKKFNSHGPEVESER